MLIRSVTNRASTPRSVSRPRRARRRLGVALMSSGSVPGACGNRVRDELQRQLVTGHAEPGDDAGRDRRDHRMVPKILARVDVADMYLDQRRGELLSRI